MAVLASGAVFVVFGSLGVLALVLGFGGWGDPS